MRELVYVSRAKLSEFFKSRRVRYRGSISAEIEGSLANMLKLKIGGARGSEADGSPPSSDDLQSLMKHVDDALEHLDNSDTPPAWFESDSQPGSWVQFEVDMALATHEDLLFLWPSSISVQVSDTTLILHGSARHLVSRAADQQNFRSVYDEQHRESDFYMFVAALSVFFRTIDAGGTWRGADDRPPRSLRRWPWTSLAQFSAELVRRLRTTGWKFGTAGRMNGFARVTAVETVDINSRSTRVVFATPLFIERL